jgi:hypothetical protein
MSFVELTKEVLRLKKSDRRKLLRLLLAERATNDPRWAAEMRRRKKDMKAGRKVSRAQAMRLLGIVEFAVAGV